MKKLVKPEVTLGNNQSEGAHHITVPNHKPLKVGTLSFILNDIASHFKMSKKELYKDLFS